MQVSTDDNDMGGFFVRKVAGAASLAVHLQKLVPLLVQFGGTRWNRGHYRPLLVTSVIANLCLAAFYASYMGDFVAAGAQQLPMVAIGLLLVESSVFAYYLVAHLSPSKVEKGPAVAMTEGRTPDSVPSRIVSRTILLVSSAMALIAGRDLFFPGFIFEYVPRDDIYLEWTNALVHSPPPGSPEDADAGLEAPLHVGDKFASQYAAISVLLTCLYKYASALTVRYGSDGGGLLQAKMIWKVQAVGDAALLFVVRTFAHAARSASLDLRWHLMCIAYETFILGLYGYF